MHCLCCISITVQKSSRSDIRDIFMFQIFALHVENFDLEKCEKAATYLKNLTSVRLSTVKNQEFDVENAVGCMQAFVDNGKLRSASFRIDTRCASRENSKLWRRQLMRHSTVVIWSKVTRVRCELI